MTKFVQRRTVLCLLGLTAASWSVQPVAFALPATEVTQMANNFELVAQYTASMRQLAQQIALVTTALNQYETMIKNLEQLPGAIVSVATDPVKDVLGASKNLKNSAKRLNDSATEAGSRWQRHVDDAANLQLPPGVYFYQQRRLAETRGGEYKKQYDQDLKTMDRVMERAKDMQKVIDQTPQVSGAVEGLQLLGRQMNEMIESTLSLRFLMTNANSRDLQDRMDREEERLRSIAEAKRNMEVVNKQSMDVGKFIQDSTVVPSWKK
jgi:type IV secretion system protein TrbJ